MIRAKLQNGLKLALLPKTTRGGTVEAELQIHFGDLTSLSGRNAVAEMTSSLLMRGTKTMTRQQIQDQMVKLDAQISVFGTVSGVTAMIQTKKENLIPALHLVAEILRDPSFPESEFDQVRKQRIAFLENGKVEPGALAPLALARSLNPFPKPDVRYIGTIDEQIDDLNKVTLDDVKKFYSQFYGASHGHFVVVGQFDALEVQKAASELFGAWTSAAPYRRITADFKAAAPVNLKIETPDKQNATFAAELNFPMSDTDPDYAAMVVANYIFGGSITSRAPNRIRNKEGLSYGVNSRLTIPAEGTMARFGGTAISNPKNAPKVEASFRDELAKTLADGFTADEVAQAKIAIHDQRMVSRSQDQGLLRLIADRTEYDRTLQWDADLDAKIQALTVDQINAAFRGHIDASSLSIVKAGDFKTNGAYE